MLKLLTEFSKIQIWNWSFKDFLRGFAFKEMTSQRLYFDCVNWMKKTTLILDWTDFLFETSHGVDTIPGAWGLRSPPRQDRLGEPSPVLALPALMVLRKAGHRAFVSRVHQGDSWVPQACIQPLLQATASFLSSWLVPIKPCSLNTASDTLIPWGTDVW